MGNNTKPQLIIDGIEYDIESLNDQQKVIFEHVVDLERKVASAKFNLDQLKVGRDVFLNMLKQSLAEQPGKEVE
jgi:hypothetical protein